MKLKVIVSDEQGYVLDQLTLEPGPRDRGVPPINEADFSNRVRDYLGMRYELTEED